MKESLQKADERRWGSLHVTSQLYIVLGAFGARIQLQRAKDTFWKLSLRGLVDEIIHCNISISIMATVEGDQLLKQVTGRNTRGLLRLIILCTIAAAAVSSRLFSVIRFESIIHECQFSYTNLQSLQLTFN